MSSSHVRSTGTAVALATVSAIALATPAQAGAAQPSAPTTRTVGYFSDKPLPTGKSTAVSGLPASARAQLAGRGGASPQTDTPRGYKLRKGRLVTDYIYKSADVWAIEARCDSDGCHPVQQIKLALKEYARGRTSRKWELTFYGSHWSGPSHFSMEYYYQCGVNISGATDKTCSSWRRDGAQGSSSGVAVNEQQIVRDFGNTNVVTKFPMINLMVEFNDGSWAIGDDGKRGEKFRGWDVCVTRTTTKMCHSTGDGG